MECDGFSFSTLKIKEILNGMIKGFEKCQFHNSLPGAIRRDVPFYRDLAEIYGVHGRWPHIQISRTIEMRTKRKFRLRLQASQQLWSSDESRALLQVYPDVLEAHVSQNLSHQTSDLWLQVAKAFAATGYPKRDVPEIAIHFGLLRQGYSQGNKFPFMNEMRRIKETEEAVCYSPDVSKFTGDVEITYWNHEAVNHLLDLYLKFQPTASSSHGCKDEVFLKIKEKMIEFGYGYTKDQVFEQFKTLLTQFNTRITKPWTSPPGSRKIHNTVAAPYWQKLHEVLELRKNLSLSWTKGMNWHKKNKKSIVDTEEFPDKNYLGWVSEEENSGCLNSQEKEESDVAAEYLAFALTCLKENVNIKMCGNIEGTNKMHQIYENSMENNLSSWKCCGIAQNLMCEVPITSENGYKSSDNINICEISKIHNVKSFSLPSKIVKEALSNGDCGVTQFSNTGSDLDHSIPSCSYISPKREINCINPKKSGDVYKDLFGEACNIIPKRCSIETKGTFYTFPGSSSSDLVLYLPKDLPLIGHSNICSKNDSYIHQCRMLKQRKRKGNSDNVSLKSSGSEADNVRIDNLYTFKAGECYHHSEPQNVKGKPETKVIQTRSGRKTRFTFFSKALKNNSDEDTEEECFNKIPGNTILQKRPKLDPLLISKSATLKRVRPKKNREPITVLSYKVLVDGSAVVHSNSSEEPVSAPSYINNENKIFQCTPNVKNSVMSFFKEHKSERVKTEEKLLSILNNQQVEQASVITEMLDTFKEFQCKFKVKR